MKALPQPARLSPRFRREFSTAVLVDSREKRKLGHDLPTGVGMQVPDFQPLPSQPLQRCCLGEGELRLHPLQMRHAADIENALVPGSQLLQTVRHSLLPAAVLFAGLLLAAGLAVGSIVSGQTDAADTVGIGQPLGVARVALNVHVYTVERDTVLPGQPGRLHQRIGRFHQQIAVPIAGRRADNRNLGQAGDGPQERGCKGDGKLDGHGVGTDLTKSGSHQPGKFQTVMQYRQSVNRAESFEMEPRRHGQPR